MNWLWIVAGATAGFIVLDDREGGLLLGALAGAFARLLFEARSNTRELAGRLRAMEHRLRNLEQAAHLSAEIPVTETSHESAPRIEEDESASQTVIAAEPVVVTPPVAAEGSMHAAEIAPQPARSAFNDPAWGAARRPWLDRLLGGNPLAKAGVVLLFFGAASGLKMASDYGLFPPAVRLLMAALAGVALIVFGYDRARKSGKQAFGFALQGGGFALMYLSLYFAFSRYGYVGATPAFAGFALLGVGCALLAVHQDSPALAWLGLSGAFFAPALASSGGNRYVILFSHFLLLDGLIAVIGARKSWRSLNLLGFLLTALFGFAWALDRYQTDFRANIEIFLLLFFLLFTLTPALLAHYRKPAGKAWLDGTLLFGVPAVAAVAQGALGYGRDYLALTAFAAGLYYLGLAAFTRDSENTALPRAFAALAITCLTVAVPLYFGAGVTTVFWALEGAAVLAFGLQQKRTLAILAGAAIQGLAALRLVDANVFLHSPAPFPAPFFSTFFAGALALSLAGAISAWRLDRHGGDQSLQAVALVWAFVWWLLAGWNEAATYAFQHREALVLLWTMLGSLSLEWLGARLHWTAGRYASIALWPLILLAMLAVTDRQNHPLAGAMPGILPLAFAAAYWLLQRQQRDGLHAWLNTRHLSLFWMLMLAAVVEAGWLAEHLAPAVPVWAPVAILAVLCLGLVALHGLKQRNLWPVAGLESLYELAAPAPLAAGLAVGLMLLNTRFTGAWHFAYLPLLNPLDAMSLLALASLWKLADTEAWKHRLGSAAPAILGGLGLLWLTALWARIAHRYLDVAFARDALEHSAVFQAGVSLLWTAFAIAAMMLGSRRRHRQAWLAGVGLLGVVGAKLLFLDLGQASLAIRTATLLGMGGLILIAAYFAPVPPRSEIQKPSNGNKK